MKKAFLWLLVLLILVFSVNAMDVSLDFPNSNYASATDRIDFRCSASGGTVYEIELYTDVSGTWQKTGTSCLSQESCTFIVNDVSAGDYKYNCHVNDMFWASSNFSFIFTLVNDPPEFSGVLENKTWEKNTVLSNVWDLNDYFSDPNADPISFKTYGNNNMHVEIIDGIVETMSPWTDWTGTEIINFSAKDDKGAETFSNNIVLTITEDGSPPPSENCNDDIDNDDDGYIDCEDSDCASSQSSCQDAVCNSTSYDWEYSLKSSSECNSDSDCDSDEECESCLCVEESSSSSSDDDDNDVDSDDDIYIISSHNPLSKNINLKIGDSKTFKIVPSGDTVVKWYLDEEKVDTGNSYTFEPTKDGTYELKVVIGDNDDFYMWIVTVGEENILLSNICGNDKIDSGENCENCARDVKCASGEKCVNKECVTSTGFFSKVSGFAVDTKDFVVGKWKYSSILGGIIVVLVILGIVYAGKKRKDDVLGAFGRESFFSKVGKVFKRKKKKGYITKKVEDKKSVVEKQREVYIDKPFSNDEKKL